MQQKMFGRRLDYLHFGNYIVRDRFLSNMFIIFSFFLSLFFLNAHFSDGISPSTRGIGVFFGPDVTQSFLGNHESAKRFDSFLSELRRIYSRTHAHFNFRPDTLHSHVSVLPKFSALRTFWH